MYRSWLKKIEQRIIDLSDHDYEVSLLNIKWILIALSWLYGLIVRARIRLYTNGKLPQKELSCFIISIGNIMAGGTGKTPMTMYLANLLKEMGKSVVIVSRGYKGTYKGDFAIVSDGEKILLSSVESGDEPFMMAKRKASPVVVGKSRFKAGKAAIDFFNPDVIILDDGFQHIQLKRDIDIVLFDYKRPIGNKRLLPAGRLREPICSLSGRTDAFVFTRCPKNEQNQNYAQELLAYSSDSPRYNTNHKPFVLKVIPSKGANQKQISSLSCLRNVTTILYSGLANNSVFFNSIQDLKANIFHHLEFNDHHRYNRSDFEKINNMAKQLKAQFILTTEKDYVKMDNDFEWFSPVIVIGIQIEFEKPEAFKRFIESRLNE